MSLSDPRASFPVQNNFLLFFSKAFDHPFPDDISFTSTLPFLKKVYVIPFPRRNFVSSKGASSKKELGQRLIFLFDEGGGGGGGGNDLIVHSEVPLKTGRERRNGFNETWR